MVIVRALHAYVPYLAGRGGGLSMLQCSQPNRNVALGPAFVSEHNGGLNGVLRPVYNASKKMLLNAVHLLRQPSILAPLKSQKWDKENYRPI